MKKDKQQIWFIITLVVSSVVVMAGIFIGIIKSAEIENRNRVSTSSSMYKPSNDGVAPQRVEPLQEWDVNDMSELNLHTEYVVKCDYRAGYHDRPWFVDKRYTPVSFSELSWLSVAVDGAGRIRVNTSPYDGQGLNRWLTVKKAERLGKDYVRFVTAYGDIYLSTSTSGFGPSCRVEFGSFDIFKGYPSAWLGMHTDDEEERTIQALKSAGEEIREATNHRDYYSVKHPATSMTNSNWE